MQERQLAAVMEEYLLNSLFNIENMYCRACPDIYFGRACPTKPKKLKIQKFPGRRSPPSEGDDPPSSSGLRRTWYR